MDRTKTLACLLAALFLSACSRPADRIVVGAKNFTEQLILGEILAQQIERKLNVPVDRRFHLAGTLLAHQALTSGDIHVLPEYTGTALTAVLHQPPASDPQQVFRSVQQQYKQQYNLEWLPPFGFNNTFAMVVSGDAARRHGLKTLSQAAAAQTWKLGVGYEFQKRPDGLDGLLKTYPLRLEGAPVSMDLGLLYTALKNGQVGMVAANSTDGMLSVLDTVALEDDRGYFPPYECAAIVRQEALQRFPQLAEALRELSGKITEDVIRRLNHEVDAKHRPIEEVAREFLSGIR